MHEDESRRGVIRLGNGVWPVEDSATEAGEPGGMMCGVELPILKRSWAG